jgi:hypothetical protein
VELFFLNFEPVESKWCTYTFYVPMDRMVRNLMFAIEPVDGEFIQTPSLNRDNADQACNHKGAHLDRSVYCTTDVNRKDRGGSRRISLETRLFDFQVGPLYK